MIAGYENSVYRIPQFSTHQREGEKTLSGMERPTSRHLTAPSPSYRRRKPQSQVRSEGGEVVQVEVQDNGCGTPIGPGIPFVKVRFRQPGFTVDVDPAPTGRTR